MLYSIAKLKEKSTSKTWKGKKNGQKRTDKNEASDQNTSTPTKPVRTVEPNHPTQPLDGFLHKTGLGLNQRIDVCGMAGALKPLLDSLRIFFDPFDGIVVGFARFFIAIH